MMKVSIIIALYNTEKYIEKCINSVLESPMLNSDYEIIVINDGSTDDCQVIVEHLILKNPYVNINLINKKNGGQSSARNLGFTEAKGQYIFCLDSDDFINGDKFVQALDFAIKNNLDMLPIKFNLLNESGESLPFKDTYYPVGIMSGSEFLNRFVVSGAMARYFYKTSVIKNNNLRLLEGIYHEDEEFVIKFLTFVDSIAYKQHNVYNYIIRENSTVNNKDMQHRKKLIFDIITVVDKISELIGNNANNTLLVNGLVKKKEQLIISIFIRMFKEKFSRNEKQKIIILLKTKNYLPIKLGVLNFRKKIIGGFINLLFN